MGARLGAFILDGLIVGIPLAIIFAILGAAFITPAKTTCDANFSCTTSAGSGGGLIGLFYLIEIVVVLAYFGYMDGVKQQSFGKRIVHIKVADANSGGPIGFGRGVVRQLVLSVTGAICFIGYLSPFFDGTKRYQGWHDKAGNDFVVKA
jgi:uncharacterized RDD family membrane protein YckC